MSEDSDLRDRFAALRAADLRDAPPFRLPRIRAGESAAQRPSGLRWVAVGLASAVGLMLLAANRLHHTPDSLAVRHPHSARDAVPALANWRAPTDFLLETPGSQLLRSIPRIGEQGSGWQQPDAHRPSPDITSIEEHHS